MAGVNTRNPDEVAGAMYFIVGRGTEGGSNSYRLSVAGVRDSDWGDVSAVAANSGYSLGTIQVDLGQRGNWGVGKTTGSISAGETSYVDALISESSRYAQAHDLPFPQDTGKLRSDLLTHGNGAHGRSSINFIDADTRHSMNEWASSTDGKQWIHSNVDYPQVKSATDVAMGILDAHGSGITDGHRLASIALLAKTANQFPAQLPRLQATLEQGGNFEALIEKARDIGEEHRVYGGLKAASLAERYQTASEDPERAASMERAQRKVASPGFDPSSQSIDPDIDVALGAIGQGARGSIGVTHEGILRLGSQGQSVAELQTRLASLNVLDQQGRSLAPDGRFGSATHAAVEQFQRDHGLVADGVVGPRTEQILSNEFDRYRQANLLSLSDERHPGVSMYIQALDGVRAVDRHLGRETDQASCQLAGALAVGACSAGFDRVDHVVMSDDGARAYAVQGQLNSPFKQFTDVDVAKSVAMPLERSGAEFLQAVQRRDQQVPLEQPVQVREHVQAEQVMPHQPVPVR